MRLKEVLRVVNPILRGWAAYFRYGVSKQTFAYLGYYAWWRLLGWVRRKHPHLTWKQLRRRYFGADRICEAGVVLYNPAKMRVERYRGAQISTPYNVGEVDPTGRASAVPTTTMWRLSGRSLNSSVLAQRDHVESPVWG